VFEAFASRVAVSLSMQDFGMDDGHFLYGPESQHPVYVGDIGAATDFGVFIRIALPA